MENSNEINANCLADLRKREGHFGTKAGDVVYQPTTGNVGVVLDMWFVCGVYPRTRIFSHYGIDVIHYYLPLLLTKKENVT